jgi:hypothetical protein
MLVRSIFILIILASEFNQIKENGFNWMLNLKKETGFFASHFYFGLQASDFRLFL